MASPRAFLACAFRTGNGSSRIASTTLSDVERERLGLRVDQVERGLREERQRLVEREVLLQRGREQERAAVLVGRVEALEHAGPEQLLLQRLGLGEQARLAALVLVAVLDQRVQQLVGVARAG